MHFAKGGGIMGAGGVTNHGTYDIEARKLEPIYKPNSKVNRYENGEKKQSRWYGPDGKAVRNRDYSHTSNGKVPFPHDHAWNWNNPMPRGKEHLEPDYENFKD